MGTRRASRGRCAADRHGADGRRAARRCSSRSTISFRAPPTSSRASRVAGDCGRPSTAPWKRSRSSSRSGASGRARISSAISSTRATPATSSTTASCSTRFSASAARRCRPPAARPAARCYLLYTHDDQRQQLIDDPGADPGRDRGMPAARQQRLFHLPAHRDQATPRSAARASSRAWWCGRRRCRRTTIRTCSPIRCASTSIASRSASCRSAPARITASATSSAARRSPSRSRGCWRASRRRISAIRISCRSMAARSASCGCKACRCATFDMSRKRSGRHGLP